MAYRYVAWRVDLTLLKRNSKRRVQTLKILFGHRNNAHTHILAAGPPA